MMNFKGACVTVTWPDELVPMTKIRQLADMGVRQWGTGGTVPDRRCG